MFVVLVVFISQLAFQSLSLINFSKKELVGIDYLNALVGVSQQIENYRSEEMNYLLGDKGAADKLVKAQKETDQAIATMDAVNAQHGDALKSTDKWIELKSEWMQIKQSHVIDAAKSNFSNATMLIENVTGLITHVCDSSNITLDPEIVTYYLGDTYCTKLPVYLEELTFIRDISDKSFKMKSLSVDDHKQLIINENLMNNFNKIAIKDNLDKITIDLEGSPNLMGISTDVVNTLLSETTNLVSMLDSTLLGNPINFTDVIPSSRYSNLINVATELHNETENVLRKALQGRIHKNLNTFYINMAIALFSLLVIGYLFVGMYHSIVKNSRKLMRHAKKMEEGDFHHIIDVGTHDEVARAAIHLNSMRHSFFVIINEINSVLEKLVSGKDFTSRVTVSCEGSFDKLKLNINSMADLLENLIHHVDRLVEFEKLGHVTSGVDALTMESAHLNELLQVSAELIKSSQDSLQPHHGKIGDLLDELRMHKDKQELLRGEIQSFEDIVLQARILASNVAMFAENEKLGETRSEVIQFATEVRTLAQRISNVSHEIQTIENIAAQQSEMNSQLVSAVSECHSTWLDSTKRIAGLIKNMLFEADKQKQTLKKLGHEEKLLQKMANEAGRALPTHNRMDIEK